MKLMAWDRFLLFEGFGHVAFESCEGEGSKRRVVRTGSAEFDAIFVFLGGLEYIFARVFSSPSLRVEEIVLIATVVGVRPLSPALKLVNLGG